MYGCTIIDTFPAFLTFWRQAQQESTEAQIEGWASEYVVQWPELLEKQLQDYTSQDVDWREIAREKVFPFLSARVAAMKVARGHLLQSSASIYSTAQQVLGFESDAMFVIYVGIGCGAGWATVFRNSPAILFGLENIAECGWSRPPSLTGLVAHELGHLVHHHWREQRGMAIGSGPWWQLYSEGFAQRCEHVILGQDTWHQATGVNNDVWLDWCQEHKGWLAARFLAAVDADEPVRPFFGSWHDIRGRRQCGYFLGHELIMELEASASLKEIALLGGIEEQFRRVLAEFAQARTER
jgi:hypothetical protein